MVQFLDGDFLEDFVGIILDIYLGSVLQLLGLKTRLRACLGFETIFVFGKDKFRSVFVAHTRDRLLSKSQTLDKFSLDFLSGILINDCIVGFVILGIF